MDYWINRLLQVNLGGIELYIKIGRAGQKSINPSSRRDDSEVFKHYVLFCGKYLFAIST